MSASKHDGTTEVSIPALSQFSEAVRRPGVLLAGPDRHAVERTSHSFIKAGYYVWTAQTARDAFGLLRDNIALIDHLVLIEDLPDLTAVGLLKRLRKLSPAIGCCLLTNGQNPDTGVEARRLGAIVMTDTIGDKQLIEQVWRVLPAPPQ